MHWGAKTITSKSFAQFQSSTICRRLARSAYVVCSVFHGQQRKRSSQVSNINMRSLFDRGVLTHVLSYIRLTIFSLRLHPSTWKAEVVFHRHCLLLLGALAFRPSNSLTSKTTTMAWLSSVVKVIAVDAGLTDYLLAICSRKTLPES